MNPFGELYDDFLLRLMLPGMGACPTKNWKQLFRRRDDFDAVQRCATCQHGKTKDNYTNYTKLGNMFMRITC
jgi:hypothetical protein